MSDVESSSKLVFEGPRERLDTYLHTCFPEYTRSYWSNMVKHDHVSVNGHSSKAGYKLAVNDEINIQWPVVSKDFVNKIQILHEDDDLLVINKPAGMLSHSKGEFNPEYTVSDFVDEKSQGAFSGSNRPGIVHRLDRHTSGVMIAAKNPKALDMLQAQFTNRTVKKMYLAICEGAFSKDEMTIDVPLARSRKNPKTFAPDSDGKDAITKVRVIRSDELSLIAALPKTGRTHQIRVHMSHISHPILGDTAYGSTKTLEGNRFMLHAHSISFVAPSGENLTIVAELPSDMTGYMHDQDFKYIAELQDEG